MSALAVVLLLVAPAPAALAAGSDPPAGSLAGPAPSEGGPVESTGAAPGEPVGPRVRGGLLEEPPGAVVSVIVLLRGAPLSDVILEMRASHGPQDGWSKDVLEVAAGRLAQREGGLGLERGAFNETVVAAGLEPAYARDFRYLVNAVNMREIPASAVPALAKDPRVQHIQRDATVQALLAASVPLIQAPAVWNQTDALGRNMTGEGSLIANIDTGVDYTHPDFGGTLNRSNDRATFLAGTHPTFAGGWDFVNDDNDPWDDHFHGTHVAGIIGANGTLKGVAPGSRQLALKVLSSSGYGSDSNIIAALEFATDPDQNPLTDDAADASSLSLGGWAAWPDDVQALAADASTLLGTVCIIAAGNNGSQLNTIISPGISRESITVGSSTKSDSMSGFSSRGPTPALDMKPDLTAPGSSINSTRHGSTGGYRYASGTSMATPHVSGAVALIKQAHPNWTVDEVRSALVNTGVDLGRGVFEQGGGRLDALAAVNTELTATPYKLPFGRLSRLAPSTNMTLAVTNVAAGTLTLNFSASDVFGLAPNYSFVNNNTDLDYVTVSPANATLSPGQSATLTVTVTPAGGAAAGHYWGTVVADAGSTVIRVPLAYAVRAAVLLVDDDSSDRGTASAVFGNYAAFPSSSNNISEALDRAGVEHDIFTAVHYATDGPDELSLKNYDLVVWNTGYDYDYNTSFHRHFTLSARDQVALAAYLDVGGQVWLLGESIAWDIYGHANTSVPAADFLNAYMGVAFVEHDLNTPDPTNGSAGTFMAGASYATAPDWINEENNGDFASNLTPASHGFTILEGGPTNDIYNKSYPTTSLAVAVNNSTYKAVFWGFEFSWLSNATAFDDAVARTLGFLDLGQSPALPTNDLTVEVLLDPRPLDWLPILDRAWDRPFDTMWEEGQPFNVSVSVVNLGDTTQSGVDVQVQLLDNASVPQQEQTVTFATVPPLARVSSTISLTAQKHGYFTVGADLPGGDMNASNDHDESTVLIPNWRDELDSAASGWNLSGNWTTYLTGYWTAPASIGSVPGGAANDSAVSPLLNFSHVNASATDGAIRLYLRISGVISGGDAVHIETKNSSATGWTIERSLTSFSAATWWNYFLLGVPLSTLAGTEGHFRIRLETGPSSTSYFFADHFMAWTFHEFGSAMNPVISVTNVTRDEAQVLDIRAMHDWAGGDTNPSNYSYAWDFGDASGSSARNTTHAYADDGTYLVRLTIDHTSGEREVTQVPIVIANVAPSIDSASPSANPSDEGSSVLFSAVCTDPSAADTVSYLWDFGDGSPNSTSASASHPYDDDGNYTVSLTCSDEDGGVTSTSFTQAVQNVAPAVVSSGSSPNPSQEGQVVNFTANCSDVGTFDNVTYAWDFGDGSNATGANVSHTYLDDGNYTVALTCTDTGGGSDSTAISQVVDNADPTVVSATSSDNPSDEGSAVQFQASCQDAGILDTIAYEWDFGDGTAPGSGAVVNHTYVDDGAYSVTLTCTDGDGGAASSGFTQDVNNLAPTASIVSVNVSLEGDSVSFTAVASDPGILDTLLFTWDFGDSTGGSGASTVHTYRDNGLFTVTLTVTDTFPASTVAVKTIRVDNVAPSATASFAGVPLEGSSLNFSAVVSDPGALDTFTFFWQFGDGQVSGLESPSHVYLDDGTFAVNLTVTDKDGGSTTVNLPVIVGNDPPTLEVSGGGTNATEGVPVTFTINTSDAGVLDVLNVTIDFGDGSAPQFAPAGIGVVVDHAFPDEGSYNVTVAATDGDGGLATVQVTVTVENAPPLLLAEASAYVLDEGGTVNLTANASDLGATDTVSIEWDLGSLAAPVTGPEASVLLAQEGTYRVTAIATDNDGGVSTLTLEIVAQNVAPALAVELPSSVVEGVAAPFNATVFDPGTLDVVQVLWSWGDGEVSTGLNVDHAWADIGEFTVTVTATDDAGGVDLQSFLVAVANTPPRVVSIDLPVDPLEGSTLNFSATVENIPGEALTYAWTFGDTGSSQMTDPTHGYRDDGDYTITLTVSDGEGGASTLSLTMQVANVPPEVRCDVCPDIAVQGRTISVRVSATDPGRDDEFTFSLRLPEGTVLTSKDGIFDFTIQEAGEATLIITASDMDGGTSPTGVTVSVNVQLDTDRDGLPDVTDTDDDNDGVPDTEDSDPLDPTRGWQPTSGGEEIPLLWILLIVMAGGTALALVALRRRGRGGSGDLDG